MTVSLVSITEDAEKKIERFGRICYDSGAKATGESYAVFIENLLKNGHLSILEHASASFLLEGVSRACTHQLVRHRLASYTQKSQRYVREGDFEYTVPPDIAASAEAKKLFETVMAGIRDGYRRLVELGVRKEDARFLLPNAAHTAIAMTANFREWLHVIDLRVSRHAQWEIRDMTVAVWRELFRRCPSVFGPAYFDNWSRDADYKRAVFLERVKNS